MFLRRSAIALSKRAIARPQLAPRSFVTSVVRRSDAKNDKPTDVTPRLVPFEEVKTEDDLLAPGSAIGEVPTDYEQSTGLERLELLGKMQGVDIFDMRPLDASRHGTLKEPIMVKSAGDEQHAGCTGSPADSHTVIWLTMSRERPLERCPECGSVYKMEYVGLPDDPHAHDHHHGDHHSYEEPKTMADFVRPEYR